MARIQGLEAEVQAREAQIHASAAEVTSLTRQLGERPDDGYWRGRLEERDR